MSRRLSHRLAALLLLSAGACYSTSLLQEPEPLAPGRVRIGVALAGNGRGMGPEAGLRVGLPADLELRGKIAVSGGEAGINARVLDTKAVDLMVMPAYSESSIDEDDDSYFDEEFPRSHRIRAFALPVIASVESETRSVALFAGPDLRAGTRDGEGFFAWGGHVGLSIRAGSHVSITPECSLLHVLAGPQGHPATADYRSNTAFAQGYVTGQCGLGLTAGGKHASSVSDQPGQ